MEKVKTIALIILSVMIALLINRSCNQENKIKNTDDTYKASIDSLHKEINSKGEEITKTRLMLTDYEMIKHRMFSADSTIKKLQQIIDKHTLSATVLNNSTHDHGSTTTTITNIQYVPKHDTMWVYPTYKSSWAERWSKGTIIATKDSITRDYTVFNEFAIKQAFERNGKGIKKYFMQRVPTVEVTNKNPMTQTLDLKSFQLEPDKKGKRAAFLIGIISGAIASGFLVKQILK